MYISYEYYRIFYQVAACGNLTRAAEILQSNQPNLTRAIKNLEAEIGCPLFLRTNRGMVLTPEGEGLYRHVRVACAEIEAGENALTQSRDLTRGSVFLAASEGALRCLLLPVLKQFRLLYPGIHLRISNHSTPQAIDALKNGTADFAVVTTPTLPVPSLTEIPIKPIVETAVCTPYFAELTEKTVSLSWLTEFPLISLGKDTRSFGFYSAFFAAHGVRYEPDIEAFTADQILPMVQADLGIGFVPEEFLREGDGVCRIRLAEPIPERQIVLIQRKDQPLSLAAKALKQRILQPIPTE